MDGLYFTEVIRLNFLDSFYPLPTVTHYLITEEESGGLCKNSSLT